MKVPGGNVSQWNTPKQTELTEAWPTGPPTHVHQLCCVLGQVLPTKSTGAQAKHVTQCILTMLHTVAARAVFVGNRLCPN